MNCGGGYGCYVRAYAVERYMRASRKKIVVRARALGLQKTRMYVCVFRMLQVCRPPSCNIAVGCIRFQGRDIYSKGHFVKFPSGGPAYVLSPCGRRAWPQNNAHCALFSKAIERTERFSAS